MSSISLFTGGSSRVTGIASGMDTEQIISDLMKVERLPLDRLYQKRQLAEWRGEAYRESTTMLKSFKDEFFDVLKPQTYMLSQSTYQKFTAESSDSEVVTASGGAGLTSMAHTIIVNSIATSSKAVSTGTVSKLFKGDSVDSFTVNAYDNSFKLTYNGTTKTITIPNGTYADGDAIVGNGTDGLLKQLVKDAFSGVDVTVEDGAVKFTTQNVSDELIVSTNAVADTLLSELGLNSEGKGTEKEFPITVEAGRKFRVSFAENGVTTNIEVEWDSDQVYNDSITLAADIQSKINAGLGEGKLYVSGADGKLSFVKSDDAESFSLANAYRNDEIVGSLGFESGDNNKLSLNDKMSKISDKLGGGTFTFDAEENMTLTVNGENIKINAEDTLSTFLYKVNNSKAGVKISYSAFTDTFTMESKTTGEGSITLDDGGSGFFNSIKLTNIVDGQDAEFELDGMAGTRSHNNFIVDGVTYTLLKADPGVEKSISLTRDVETVFDTIKGFIDKYNGIIEKMNGKLSEKYDRNYQPLTQEEREALSEDEIENWEKRAKTGLLRNDSLLQSIVYEMRKAFVSSVEDTGISLSSIGITTGSYENKGKLEIDETKLKSAISQNPDGVMNLFSKKSISVSSYSRDLSSEDRATRYNEQGIIYRLSDILEDNISIYRDKNGNKGSLLQKAGMENDSSDFNNFLYDQISDYTDEIAELTEKLINKENSYFNKFTAMEKYISQMNAQSNWMMSQFSQS